MMTESDFLRDHQKMDITPIIAHAERHWFLIKDPVRLYHWIQMGIPIQITTSSLMGHFGKRIQRFSTLLLEHHMVHILATDAHGIDRRRPLLSAGYRVAQNILGTDAAQILVKNNPFKIIKGDELPLTEPIPLKSTKKRSFT